MFLKSKRAMVFVAAGLALFAAPALADKDAGNGSDVSAILELTADPAYGAYLAGECATCHASSGTSQGVPRIAGMAREDFILALVEYRAGVRDNQVMQTTAARLSDEEIAALAAHFSAQ
jgi:cytochrome c553